jgi:hypothetical protein
VAVSTCQTVTFFSCDGDDFWKVCRYVPVGDSAAARRPGSSKTLTTASERQSYTVAEAEATVARSRTPSAEKDAALHAVLDSLCGGLDPGV